MASAKQTIDDLVRGVINGSMTFNASQFFEEQTDVTKLNHNLVAVITDFFDWVSNEIPRLQKDVLTRNQVRPIIDSVRQIVAEPNLEKLRDNLEFSKYLLVVKSRTFPQVQTFVETGQVTPPPRIIPQYFIFLNRMNSNLCHRTSALGKIREVRLSRILPSPREIGLTALKSRMIR